MPESVRGEIREWVLAGGSWLTVAAPEYWLYFLGALFIGVTLFLPNGVAGLVKQILRRVKP